MKWKTEANLLCVAIVVFYSAWGWLYGSLKGDLDSTEKMIANAIMIAFGIIVCIIAIIENRKFKRGLRE